MTGREGDKQRQGVSSRKPLLTLLLGNANIGQKREQAIANLSWSFKLEGDAEDWHKWSLNACKCCVSTKPTKPSSCLIQQPSFEQASKRKTKQSTLKTSKHSKLEFNWSRVQKLVSLLSRWGCHRESSESSKMLQNNRLGSIGCSLQKLCSNPNTAWHVISFQWLAISIEWTPATCPLANLAARCF